MNRNRGVFVFYTIHNTSDFVLENADNFFAENERKIEKTVWELQAATKLMNITKTLDQQNIGLTGKDRYNCQLWIRSWSSIGDCPLESKAITNSEVMNYMYLPYYYRNAFTLYACENYHLYSFP